MQTTSNIGPIGPVHQDFRGGFGPTRCAVRQKLGIFDRVTLIALFIFLLSEVFQAPLRYYLSAAGGVFLAYLPKALMVLAFSILLVKIIFTGRLTSSVFGAFIFFSFSIIIGLIYTNAIIQPALGIVALMPVFFGIIAEKSLSRYGSDRIAFFVLLLWLSAAVGVGYNYFRDVPWTGFSYQIGDTDVEVSRDWTYFGVSRVAGFSRASYEAAAQLLFFAIPCVLLLRSKLLSVFIWISTGFLIAATTSKTTLGIFIPLTLLIPFMASRGLPRSLKRFTGWSLPFIFALIGILLPASTLFFKSGQKLVDDNSGTLLVSFGVRLAESWPSTFSMLMDNGSLLWGRGIGGIGVAQKVFEPDLYVPPDNIFLYLYAIFGVLMFPMMWKIVNCLSNLNVSRSKMSLMFWMLGVAMIMEGWTVTCLEGGTMAITIGLIVAYAVRPSNRH